MGVAHFREFRHGVRSKNFFTAIQNHIEVSDISLIVISLYAISDSNISLIVISLYAWVKVKVFIEINGASSKCQQISRSPCLIIPAVL
jgi:hypothetical protein